MHSDKEYLIDLLSKFADNTISEDEYRILRKYVADADSDAQLYGAMDHIWTSLNTGLPFEEFDREQVYHKITSDPRFTKAGENETTALRSFWPWLRIAASILIILSAALSTYFFTQTSKTSRQVTYLEKTAPKGQKTKITLPDGSTVFLNADSKIHYPQTFTGDFREVDLEGEAYFDVVHDTAKPFIVKSRGITTRVLGTAFNIKTYHENEIRISVLRGKVSVADKKRELGILTRDDNLVYNAISKKVVISKVDAASITAWKGGELVLDNVTMQEATEIIGRWYNVDFKFENESLMSQRFNVSFLKGENIVKVMDVISQLNGFKYKIDGSTIILLTKDASNAGLSSPK